jgi:hypothetical protein
VDVVVYEDRKKEILKDRQILFTAPFTHKKLNLFTMAQRAGLDPNSRRGQLYELYLQNRAAGMPNQYVQEMQMTATPVGVLQPVVEDPPFAPALIIPQERAMHWMEAALFFLLVLVIMNLGPTAWISVVVLLFLLLCWQSAGWRANVARHNELEELRQAGRLLPAPLTQQNYQIQPF